MELFIIPLVNIFKRCFLKYEIASATEIDVSMDYMRSCIYSGPKRLLIYRDWYSRDLWASQFEVQVNKIINNNYTEYTKNNVALINSLIHGHILICGNHPRDLPVITGKDQIDIFVAASMALLLYYYTGTSSIIYLFFR